MKGNKLSDEDRQVRDASVRESWPMNDPRATYPLAEQARTAQAEGRRLADA